MFAGREAVGSEEQIDLGVLSDAEVAQLFAVGSPSRVDGHVRADAGGGGLLCPGSSPREDGCGDEGVAVDLSAWIPASGQPIMGQVRVEGPFVVGAMTDRVITQLWTASAKDPEIESSAQMTQAFALWNGHQGATAAPDQTTAQPCASQDGDCGGTVDMTMLDVATPSDYEYWWDRDGFLPDEWVLVDQMPDFSSPDQFPLADPTSVPTGLEEGDLVRVVIDGTSSVTSIERFQLPQTEQDGQ